MKIGTVIAQERQRRNLKLGEVAARLNMSVAAYEDLEAGKNADLESAAALVLAFNELIEGQVGQLYYPCGIPFTQVQSYSVTP